MLVKTNQEGYGGGNKKKDSNKKEDRVYDDHYKEIGHTKDSCFKIYGYLEWFKQLKKEKGSTSKVQVNLANSPLEELHMIEKKRSSTVLSQMLSDLV